MREMDLSALMREVVLERNRQSSGAGTSVQLSIPPNLSPFLWRDGSLEKLIETFVKNASSIYYPIGPVRIAVRQKKKLMDLEKFFDIYPSHWIQLRIEGKGLAGFDEGARRIFQDLGYQCEEWIGVEGSERRLASFHFGAEREPKLVFWANSQKYNHKCDLLIPVTNPIS